MQLLLLPFIWLLSLLLVCLPLSFGETICMFANLARASLSCPCGGAVFVIEPFRSRVHGTMHRSRVPLGIYNVAKGSSRLYKGIIRLLPLKCQAVQWRGRGTRMLQLYKASKALWWKPNLWDRIGLAGQEFHFKHLGKVSVSFILVGLYKAAEGHYETFKGLIRVLRYS